MLVQVDSHTCTIVNSTFVDFQRGNLWLAAPIVKLTLALEGDLKAAQCGEAIWKLQLLAGIGEMTKIVGKG